MSNPFDAEFERVAKEQRDEAHALTKEHGAERLRRLKCDIEGASKAGEGVLSCSLEGETLVIMVMGQRIGEWTNEDATLTLYRAGAPTAECRATSVAEAVKLTARLVAAVAQA